MKMSLEQWAEYNKLSKEEFTAQMIETMSAIGSLQLESLNERGIDADSFSFTSTNGIETIIITIDRIKETIPEGRAIN